ncbi:anti-sigma factor [Nocardia pseudobrasiliensis]|uniref:Regulator of SigK n=1 Tax=Nocardia pseudobrasiliensis TaxID=45979 RepID=A0A370IBZ4_9NOCA|nr:anti-sigma factor [Nocardia pseudobrasiliensis]RDI68227.1 anti-sigma-K factor RskA [Nocardia pseudobrasiliensis]
MNTDDLLDQVYPYALDAVSDEQRRRIEQARDAVDPELAARFDAAVARVRDTMADLTVVDSLAPPAGLEARVLAALDRSVGAKTDEPQKLPSKTRWRWLAAAAAVLVAIGAGVVAGNRHTESPPSSALTTLRMIEEQRDAVTRSSGLPNGGTIVVHTSPALELVAVSFEGVQPPAAGHSYQLWMGPTDEGLMQSAVVLVQVPREPFVAHYIPSQKMALTVEPASGSPQPTTEPIAQMTLD